MRWFLTLRQAHGHASLTRPQSDDSHMWRSILSHVHSLWKGYSGDWQIISNHRKARHSDWCRTIIARVLIRWYIVLKRINGFVIKYTRVILLLMCIECAYVSNYNLDMFSFTIRQFARVISIYQWYLLYVIFYTWHSNTMLNGTTWVRANALFSYMV